MTSTDPTLASPLYGASPVQAVARFFRKYAVFSGRASRSEYWWVALAFGVLVIVLAVLGAVAGSAGASSDGPGPGFVPFAILLVLLWLAIIVPSIALTVRRLHDANLSGLLVLLTFIPYVGGLIVTIMNILPPNPMGARFDAGATAVAYQPPPAAGSTPPPPPPTAG